MISSDFDSGLRLNGRGEWYSSPPDYMTVILGGLRSVVRLQSNTPELLKSPPAIHLDLARNSQLGASTFIYNGQYFIALNHGSFHVLGDLFSRLLSDSRVLTWVGNA